MSTLGEELSDLLQRNGIRGPILHIEGGPTRLTVLHYQLDGQGRKFFDDDGNIAVATVELDLYAETVSA